MYGWRSALKEESKEKTPKTEALQKNKSEKIAHSCCLFFELYSLSDQSEELLFTPSSIGVAWSWLSTSYQCVI